MKKLIPIILISSIFIYLIFMITNYDTTNILSIGDIYSDGYNNNYYPSYNDYLKESLKYDNYDVIVYHDLKETLMNIKDNQKVNERNIKRIIKDSDIVILNLGIEQIKNNESIINSNYLNNYLNDYETLLKELIQLNSNIYIINIPKNIISNKYQMIINDYYSGLAKRFHLKIIDVKDVDISSINPVIYQSLNSLELTN